MNAFKDACHIEQEALLDIVPFIKAQSDRGQFVLTDKGRLSKELQQTYGDALSNAGGRCVAVEFKAEYENKHGNFFLETWSNCPHNPGWMFKLNADVLLYYFLCERLMFSIPFQGLKKWSFSDGNLWKFPERVQSKRDQLNETRGRVVPIDMLLSRLPGIRRYQFFGAFGNYEEITCGGGDA